MFYYFFIITKIIQSHKIKRVTHEIKRGPWASFYRLWSFQWRRQRVLDGDEKTPRGAAGASGPVPRGADPDDAPSSTPWIASSILPTTPTLHLSIRKLIRKPNLHLYIQIEEKTWGYDLLLRILRSNRNLWYYRWELRKMGDHLKKISISIVTKERDHGARTRELAKNRKRKRKRRAERLEKWRTEKLGLLQFLWAEIRNNFLKDMYSGPYVSSII